MLMAITECMYTKKSYGVSKNGAFFPFLMTNERAS